ncbi:MAG: hypothetical protein ACJ8F3_14005 [Xanthobacteraceae bacterium]
MSIVVAAQLTGEMTAARALVSNEAGVVEHWGDVNDLRHSTST